MRGSQGANPAEVISSCFGLFPIFNLEVDHSQHHNNKERIRVSHERVAQCQAAARFFAYLVPCALTNHNETTACPVSAARP